MAKGAKKTSKNCDSGKGKKQNMDSVLKPKKKKIGFKNELSQFLPQGHQRIIKDFKNILLSEIRRFV